MRCASMTTSDYIKRYSALLAVDESIKLDDVDSYVRTGVELGLSTFWGVLPWSFKTYEYTLTLTAAAESYALPDDTEAVQDVREEETNTGYKLRFLIKEDFDEMVPRLAHHNNNTPQLYTLYYDTDKQKMYIKFWPPAGGSESFYMTILRRTPADCSLVPGKYEGALDAFIAKFVYPHGHPGHASAVATAEMELRKAHVADKQKFSRMTQMGTEDDRQFIFDRPWLP